MVSGSAAGSPAPRLAPWAWWAPAPPPELSPPRGAHRQAASGRRPPRPRRPRLATSERLWVEGLEAAWAGVWAEGWVLASAPASGSAWAGALGLASAWGLALVSVRGAGAPRGRAAPRSWRHRVQGTRRRPSAATPRRA